MLKLHGATGGFRTMRRISHLLELSTSFHRPTPVCCRSSFSMMQSISSHILQRHHIAERLPALLLKSASRGRTTGNTFHRSLSLKQKKWRFRELCTRAGSPRQVEYDTAVVSSSSPPCLSVSIWCRKREVDALSEALLCFGASSASMDESDDLDADKEVCIASIFSADQDVSRCISLAAKSISMRKTPKFEVTVSEDFNWVQNVKDTFHPIQVTDGLWIVPEWRTPEVDNAINIFLNPGMAFGTGEHPTTKLCLFFLKGLIKGGEHILDYGTGSGVLGIAAVKMGAAFSVGVDIEPQALSSARQNIALNSIEPERMPLYLAPVEDRSNSINGPFDIIVANILLNPLMELAEELVSYGKRGTVVGLSGILLDQVSQVEEKYSMYLESISVSEMDGWACLTGTQR